MKVMFLPLNYGDVRQNGVSDAFRAAGCNLKEFDYFKEHSANRNLKVVRAKLVTRVNDFKPDLLHVQIQHTNIIDHNTISLIKSQHPRLIVSNWTGDVRNYIPPTYKNIAKVADYNLISSTGQLPMFRKAIGNNVHYWQIGYDPKLYFPEAKERPRFDADCIFIGHHNKREKYPGAATRINACSLLRREFGSRFKLFGANWPNELASSGSVDQKTVSSKYYSSLCSISISHYNDLSHYFSDRLLMALASGRPVISLRFPGWESYFTHMSDLIIVDDINQIPSMVRWCQKNPEHAAFIGKSGAAKVAAEHTYFNRVIELLEILKLR